MCIRDRYPGALGNSLRVSVCDSALAFESTFTGQTNSTFAADDANSGITAACSVGSTSLILTSKGYEAGDVSSHAAHTTRVDTNNVINQAQTFFTVGDNVRLGNSTIGYQTVKISAIGATAMDATYTSGNNTTEWTGNVVITIADKYRLSSDYSANSSQGDDINSGGITRFWEYRDNVDAAPGQTEYSNNVANNTANDELHIVIADQDGDITGRKGEILEVFEGVSRASDAKNESGESIYYKDVIDNQSKWVWVGGTDIRATSNVNTAAILPFSAEVVFFIIAISPSKIPSSIIDRPLTFKPKYVECFETSDLGTEIMESDEFIASIASPAAIEPTNGIFKKLFSEEVTIELLF